MYLFGGHGEILFSLESSLSHIPQITRQKMSWLDSLIENQGSDGFSNKLVYW